ncbi:MAG: flagellar export protein FliJ [Moheibacter sp.]
MKNRDFHSFHIPVMGIGFTIDTPVKVAHFGIDSVISIVDDIVIEQLREFYYAELGLEFNPIGKRDEDFRARRITDYLNLVNQMVLRKFEEIKAQNFDEDSELSKYFLLLPDASPLKKKYLGMLSETDDSEKSKIQQELKAAMRCGSIDVNIMAKVDNPQYDKAGNQLPEIYNDAMAALRGYANSELNSSIVLSAGLNPRLYAYFEQFADFYPDEKGFVKKKIILKVSDYRSATIQGKMLAKKGLMVSEFRIESGLNCGGHAFATDGKLLGTILEEFKNRREPLAAELFEIANQALIQKNHHPFEEIPEMKITVQGGIGTANESNFLIEYFKVDSTGWGSPFLLVPEATNVDEETLHQLANAKKEDYYLSDASPLGVPFNNFRNTSSQQLLNERVEKKRPGSPCLKKYLEFDTEFTEKSICTASRQYQDLKLKQLGEQSLSKEEFDKKAEKILEKECLCEGLAIPAVIVNNALKKKQLRAVAICPGPNLAYFSGVFSLKEMIDHIYGRNTILNSLKRENMFINELEMYVDHFQKEIGKSIDELSAKQIRHYENFKNSLLEGIDHYKVIFRKMKAETDEYRAKALKSLEHWEKNILHIQIPGLEPVS